MTTVVELFNQDLAQVDVAQVRNGQVAWFSARSPLSHGSNEDSCLVWQTESCVVVAVADGAGGAPEGERASRVCLQGLARCLSQPTELVRAAILDGFEAANRAVLDLGSGAATTLSVVEIAENEGRLELRSYHAGDSGVVCCGNRGKLKLSTIPHSPVGYGVEAGLIDVEAALHHDDLNLVSNMIGMADMRIEMGSALRLNQLDTVVVGSDGLFDNLHQVEIIECVRKGPLRHAAGRLRKLAQERMSGVAPGPSKPDDLTFVVFRSRMPTDNRSARGTPQTVSPHT